MENKMLDISVNGTSIRRQNLRNIIKTIAICHSREISKETKSVPKNKRQFEIVKNVQELLSLKVLNCSDQPVLDNEVQAIEETVKTIMDSSILVKDQGIKELVPLSYEVLSLIFVSTDEKFRQHFFQELLECYYNELCEDRKLVCSQAEFHQQVKALLPIIKFETALRFKKNKGPKSQSLLKEIASNIMSFFKYSRLNQEDIYTVVNNRLGSKNYELLSYEMTPLCTHNGHLGEYFKLKVNVEFENVERTLDLFVKFLTPKLESMKKLAHSGPSKKEEFFYMTYLPLLEKHGPQSLLDFCPKCYLSRVNDVLVLDDMMSFGFSTVTLDIKVDLDGLMFVVKQIAKIHSCCMILEELLSKGEGKKVTLDQIYFEYLQEVIFNLKDKFIQERFDSSLDILHYLAEKYSELNTKFTHDEFIKKINAAWKFAFKQVQKSKKFKNTICHGDMYVGNMLFKFDSNGICLDATLVDFQTLRYCPSVHDLLFLIYQNSSKDTRDKHFRELVDGYYFELSKHLKSFNLDIAKIYPKLAFEESLNYMKSQSLLQALFYSPLNNIPPSIKKEFMKNKEMGEKYLLHDKLALIDLGLKNDSYRKVMCGLMEDLAELCDSGLI